MGVTIIRVPRTERLTATFSQTDSIYNSPWLLGGDVTKHSLPPPPPPQPQPPFSLSPSFCQSIHGVSKTLSMADIGCDLPNLPSGNKEVFQDSTTCSGYMFCRQLAVLNLPNSGNSTSLNPQNEKQNTHIHKLCQG